MMVRLWKGIPKVPKGQNWPCYMQINMHMLQGIKHCNAKSIKCQRVIFHLLAIPSEMYARPALGLDIHFL